jgi:restriction system protein
MKKEFPTFDRLMNPLFLALQALGGSGSIEEIYDKVVELEEYSEDLTSVLHDENNSNQTEIAYRLAWARTYMKKYGYLENSKRGIWSLTEKAKGIEKVNVNDILKTVREAHKKIKSANINRKPPKHNENTELFDDEDLPVETQLWREQLHQILIQCIKPDAFERLIKRLLRESGFVQVEVTGRSGDGGIDGKGIAKIHGFMSFHVIFQCKKYQGSVGAPEIRDFRGAMVGRADKGLFITTGTFTPAAVKEATRDGAPPIDLVDGDQLADKLKEFQLGINCEMIENVTVKKEWFENL